MVLFLCLPVVLQITAVPVRVYVPCVRRQSFPPPQNTAKVRVSSMLQAFLCGENMEGVQSPDSLCIPQLF